jgi:hypothetical protein
LAASPEKRNTGCVKNDSIKESLVNGLNEQTRAKQRDLKRVHFWFKYFNLFFQKD